MKRLFLVCALMVFGFSLFAQEEVEIKEVKKGVQELKIGGITLRLEQATDEKKDEGMWWAKSVVGKKFPLLVEKWISEVPDTTGKFRVVEFWATWCGPCKKSIPHLNELSKKFKKDIVFIGLTDESPEQVKTMKTPVIEYYSASDSKQRLNKGVLDLKCIPHAIVVNPEGIACWEGEPRFLSEEILDKLLEDYKANQKHKK